MLFKTSRLFYYRFSYKKKVFYLVKIIDKLQGSYLTLKVHLRRIIVTFLDTFSVLTSSPLFRAFEDCFDANSAFFFNSTVITGSTLVAVVHSNAF